MIMRLYPTMENELTPILQSALASRERLLGELKRVEQIIALSSGRGNATPVASSDPPRVLPHQFAGKKLLSALESYLRECPATKAPLVQAIDALISGGIKPGLPRGAKTDPAELISHKLKIGISAKPRIFQWEPTGVSRKGKLIVAKHAKPEEIFIWLAPTANEPNRKPTP